MEPKEIMRVFDAWGIAMLLHHIDERRAFAQKMCDGGGGDDRLTRGQIDVFATPIIHLASYHAQRTDLQSTYDRVWDNGPFCMAAKIGQMTNQNLLNELTVLRQAIEADLEKRSFVFILPGKEELVREIGTHWSHVWEVIPKSKHDTEEAVYCYALERNTAAVFHSMRVAEFGLRYLAKKVGAKLIDKGKPQPIEFATWDKVITGIKNKITAAHAMPKGPRRNKLLTFYSDVAEQCTWIRDIWRNEVSHTRKNWNGAEALGVLNRVRDFMLLLSSQKKSKGKKP
jgi:hypothetical protein